MKVLRRGTDHRWPAYVDVLDQFLEVHTLFRGGFLKRIEIHDDHVDRLDSVLGNGGTMRGVFAAMENSAMHLRMERFNATIQHFGEAGEVGDVFDGDAGIAQEFRRAAGGDELDAEGGELASEVNDANFINDTENCALDFVRHCRLGSGSGRRILSQEEGSCFKSIFTTEPRGHGESLTS